MGRYIYRPQYSTDYGEVETVGSGVVLGDQNDNTYKRYFENAGSIMTFPVWNGAGVPAGKTILCVRAGHRQRNTGIFGLYNGWVVGYLRINNARQQSTRAYKQDGYIDSAREILGPALYKNAAFESWTPAEISTMGTETMAAEADIDTDKRWCVVAESYIQVIYDDPVIVPTITYPSNNQTIATSSVQFAATCVPTQEEQPVRAVFQVARDSAFTSDVRTFVGGLNASTAAGSKSFYVSKILDPSYTELGPGKWYVRVKGRDFRGSDYESAWGTVTSFTINHGPLPVPTLTAPQAGQVLPTPYGIRSAYFNTQPSGERKVGANWSFSKDSTFNTGVVSWTNTANGFFIADASQPKTVSYNAEPTDFSPGQNAGLVSFEDPSQYLSQGTWFGRVRAMDVYGQPSAWSSNYQFSVSHPPVVGSTFPSGGIAFDQNVSNVSWQFTDPWAGDYQTAYRMVVRDPSSNILQDTGKVLGNFNQADMDVAQTFLEQNMSYTLEVWDADDIKSAVKTSNFRMSKAPVITITSPAADEELVTGQPTFQWSVVFATGAVTQASWELRVVNRYSGILVHTTGNINSTATSYTPPLPILKNIINYQVVLRITDSQGITNTGRQNFKTNFIRPASFPTTVDAADYDNSGHVKLTWDATPDGFFQEWRVYRRHEADPVGEWEFVDTVYGIGVREYQDWYVAGSGNFAWSVVQVASRYGSPVESLQTLGSYVNIAGSHYWLVIPGRPELNVKLVSVVADKYTQRIESNSFDIIGGGTHVNYGNEIGREGDMTLEVRDSAGHGRGSETIRHIYSVFRERRWVYLRDPFGTRIKISVGEFGLDRMAGVGTNEYGAVTIPYKQVGGVNVD